MLLAAEIQTISIYLHDRYSIVIYLCFVVKFTISFICISSVPTFIISWIIVYSSSRTFVIQIRINSLGETLIF